MQDNHVAARVLAGVSGEVAGDKRVHLALPAAGSKIARWLEPVLATRKEVQAISFTFGAATILPADLRNVAQKIVEGKITIAMDPARLTKEGAEAEYNSGTNVLTLKRAVDPAVLCRQRCARGGARGAGPQGAKPTPARGRGGGLRRARLVTRQLRREHCAHAGPAWLRGYGAPRTGRRRDKPGRPAIGRRRRGQGPTRNLGIKDITATKDGI